MCNEWCSSYKCDLELRRVLQFENFIAPACSLPPGSVEQTCHCFIGRLLDPTNNNNNKKLSYRRETAHQLTRLSRLTHWSCTSLSTASVLQLHNRLAKLVSTLSANKPCDIRTLSWIGHSRSFKVILICADRNPERCVVVMCH